MNLLSLQEHYHEHTHSYQDATPTATEFVAWQEPDVHVYRGFAQVAKTTASNSYGKIVAADKVSLAKIASETRPKNIKVVFLMKCWHTNKLT